MFCIIGLEIIIRIGNEALQIATEQEVGHHIPCIVRRIIRGTVAHTDRDMLCFGRSLELQRDGCKGLVVVFHPTHRNGLKVVIVMVHKKQAVGQGLTVFIHNEQITNACGDVRGIDPIGSTTCKFLEMFQHPSTKHRHSVGATRQSSKRDLCRYGIALGIHLKRTTHLLRLRQTEDIVFIMIVEAYFHIIIVGHVQREHTSALIQGADGNLLVPHLQRTLNIHPLTFLGQRLERHITTCSGNEMTAFGVEVHGKTFLEFLFHAGLRPTHDVFLKIVACGIRTFIYGNHPTIDGSELTEEVVSHLTVVELLTVLTVVWVLCNTEIQHPAGVGPQLVIAGIKRVAQGEVPIAMTIWRDNQTLSFNNQAIG